MNDLELQRQQEKYDECSECGLHAEDCECICPNCDELELACVCHLNCSECDFPLADCFCEHDEDTHGTF